MQQGFFQHFHLSFESAIMTPEQTTSENTLSTSKQQGRILSGIRPTGGVHLGNYHGAIKNWVERQSDYESFICIVDLHALTTDYATPQNIAKNTWNMAIDLLAAGVDPKKSHLFIQSRVPEHSELHLLLSMITPLSWLSRVPTYKDQQQQLKEKDLTTYGFLGYPLLQSADILLYKASHVPVGEDQAPHIELTREIARRFNHLYGQDQGYLEKAKNAIGHLDKKSAKRFQALCKDYQEKGNQDALQSGQAILEKQQSLSSDEKERLLGYIEGKGRVILPEPELLLTKTSVFPGLDGRKMSKSYKNTISLRDTPEEVTQKIRKMPTDPARIRRTDPGEPEKCPVWDFHKIYSNEETREWVEKGCKSAGIGCLDCKQRVIDAMIEELAPIAARAKEFEANPEMVQKIINEGCDAARKVAQVTLAEVKRVMGISSGKIDE